MKQPISKTFRKGKETLIRKAEELSTLCDIPVCAVIVSPEGKTEIWPESRSEFNNVFDMYKEKTQTLDHPHGRRDPAKNNVQRSYDENETFDHHPGRGNPAKKNVQCTYDENDDVDELLHCLNSKIASVDSRIRVLKDIN